MARRALRHLRRVVRSSRPGLLTTVAILAIAATPPVSASGDDLAEAFAKGLERAGREEPVINRGSTGRPPTIAFGETVVKTATPALAGSKIVLEVDKGLIKGTKFQWFQVEGPKATIDDPSEASLTVTVPQGAEQLGFVLVAARPEQVRVLKVVVPVRGGKFAATAAAGEVIGPNFYPGAPAAKTVKADAGDDQVGLVGHRVTLNGAKSVPSDGKTARWMQLAGPVAQAPKQQGVYFSFVPSTVGTYRFALMVSGDGEISEPDEVSVLVGTPPRGEPVALSASSATALALKPAESNPSQVAQAVHGAESSLTSNVSRIPDGPRIAGEVADVMESVSQRSNLYSSFASLQNEMARRLDVVIPTDPSRRELWNQTVLMPLSTYSGNELAAVGLDPRNPQSRSAEITAAQQNKIRDHFAMLARAFRAVSSTTR